MNDSRLTAAPPSPSRPAVLAGLAAATVIGASSLAAGGTSSVMLGAELAGSESVAGVPLAAVVVGSGLGALLITGLQARLGRSRPLAVGYLVGAAGGVVAALSGRMGSFGGLLVGCVLFGVANAAVFLTRYAAADAGGPARGRSVGLILFATAFGAVASPALLQPSGGFAEVLGLPRLSGMFVVAAVVCAAAAAVLIGASKANPEDRLPPLRRPAAVDVGAAAVVRLLGHRDTRRALATLAISNLLMVGVMAVAPVRMAAHGHGLGLVGVVIAVHVAGMFVPSPLAGWLADRFEPAFVARLGLALLLVAGCLGALTPESHTASMVGALVLLGVGWNFGVVGGSMMLVRTVPDQLRVRAEGLGEVGMGLAAAAAAPLAGILAAVAGMAAVWLAVALVSVVGGNAWSLVFPAHRAGRDRAV